jgi:hypothetical protein
VYKHLDPWVTTSCINRDMMRLVGNALHRDMCGTDVPCIGFCNWKHIGGICNTNPHVNNQSVYNVTYYSSGHQQLTTTSTSAQIIQVIVFT